MFSRKFVLLALALCASMNGFAHEYSVGDLRIGHPYTRSTPPGAVTAGAYLSVDNKGKAADRLLRAASPAAGLVELHSMSMDGNVMRMRAVPAIEVPPGTTVKFTPGGLHFMLQDLKRVLEKGTEPERSAAALALTRSPDPGASALLLAYPELSAAVSQNKVSWQKLAGFA